MGKLDICYLFIYVNKYHSINVSWKDINEGDIVHINYLLDIDSELNVYTAI